MTESPEPDKNGGRAMARDAAEAPPHVRAHIDQLAAGQRDHDQPPDDVLIQLRIRLVDRPDQGGVAVSFISQLENSIHAVLCLRALQASIDQFTLDILRNLTDLAENHADSADVRDEVALAMALLRDATDK